MIRIDSMRCIGLNQFGLKACSHLLGADIRQYPTVALIQTRNRLLYAALVAMSVVFLAFSAHVTVIVPHVAHN